MKNIYDIQQVLKKFGAIIYVGDRQGDLELMKAEFQDLYQAQLMDRSIYELGMQILNTEIIKLQEQNSKESRGM